MALPPEPGRNKANKKVNKQVATGSRGDSGSGLDKPRPKPTVTPPRGDIATSGGDYGTKAAKKFKRTAPYRGAIREAYEAQGAPARSRAVRDALGEKSVEDNVIVKTHFARLKGDEKLAGLKQELDTLNLTELANYYFQFYKAQPKPSSGAFGAIIPQGSKLFGVVPVGAAAKAADVAIGAAAKGVGTAVSGKYLEHLPIAGSLLKAPTSGPGATAGEVATNLGQDLIDLPANFVPSAFYEGNKLAHGDVKGVANDLTKIYVDLYHHPGRTLKNEPGISALALWPFGRVPAQVIGKRGSIARLGGEAGTTGVEDWTFGTGLRGRAANRYFRDTSAKPNIMYHASSEPPEVILKRGIISKAGLKAKEPTDTVKEVTDAGVKYPKGVYLSPDASFAQRHYGRHIYAVDVDKLKKLHDDPEASVPNLITFDAAGTKYSPKNIPASAITYLGTDVNNLRPVIPYGMKTRAMGTTKPTVPTTNTVRGSTELDRRVDENLAESHGRKVHPMYNFAWEFSHKENGKVKTYQDYNIADRARTAVSKQNGMKMVPLKVGPLEDSPWVLVPDKGLDRLKEHADASAGRNRFVGQMSTLFRKGVLMSSPKWMPGNVSEGLFRDLTSRSGMLDWKSGRRAQTSLNAVNKTAGEIFEVRTTAGAHAHLAGQELREVGPVTPGSTAAFVRTPSAKAGHNIGEIARGARDFVNGHPYKGIARAYNGMSDLVFESTNGRIEHQLQTAMMGQVLRKHKIIPKALGVKNRQLANEWAKGQAADISKLRNLASAVGREIDRAYGKYGKLGPEERKMISTYTPFLRWTVNAFNFLYHILPADHPVITALAASINYASEDWRKQVGQYFDTGQLWSGKGGKPAYLQGGIPGKNDSVLRLSHFFPMGIHEQGVRGFGDLLVPFFSTLVENSSGKDWKGDKLANTGTVPTLMAILTSGIEQTIPFTSFGANLLGARLPNMAKGQKIPSTFKERLEKMSPSSYTKPGQGPSKKAEGFFGGGQKGENFFGTPGQKGESFFK